MHVILEPFHQGRDVTGSSMAGSGLGLALVRSTIEGLGAKLSLEPEVGRGSPFAIHFPVAQRNSPVAWKPGSSGTGRAPRWRSR